MFTSPPFRSRFAAFAAICWLSLTQGCQLVGYGTQTLDGAASLFDAGEAGLVTSDGSPAPSGGADGDTDGPVDGAGPPDAGPDAAAQPPPDADTPLDGARGDDGATGEPAHDASDPSLLPDAADDGGPAPPPPCQLDSSGQCKTTCDSAACEVGCDGAQKCELECAAGSSCNFLCRNSGECKVRCRAGSVCNVSCDGPGCQAVRCDEGANCTLSCSLGYACTFEACASTRYQVCLLGGQQLCGANLACPLL